MIQKTSPLATIRAYFSRRANKIRSGEINVGDERHGNNNQEISADESESDDNGCDDKQSSNEGIDEMTKQNKSIATQLLG